MVCAGGDCSITVPPATDDMVKISSESRYSSINTSPGSDRLLSIHCDQAPAIVSSRAKKALMLQREGQIQESLHLFQKCVMLNPQSVDGMKQVARCLFLLSRHRAAADVYGEAVKLSEGDWEIHHHLGVCHMYLGDTVQDVVFLPSRVGFPPLFSIIVVEVKVSGPPHILKVSLGAEGCLSRALELHHGDVTYVMLGKVYLMSGDVQKAVETYHAAVQRSPENSDLLTTLGLLYIQLNQFQKSFENFGRALAFDPTHTKAVIAVGHMLQGHGDYDVALSKYRVAATDKPDSPQLWSNIGMCFFGKKKYVAAEGCLSRALELHHGDVTYVMLGKVYLMSGDVQKAVETYHAAVQRSPENSDLLTTLGLLYIQLNQFQKSFENFGRALAFDPTHTKAVIAVGHMLQGHGDYDVALSKYRVAATDKPDSPQLWSNIGMCFFGKKKYVAAVSCLKRANYLAPSNWQVLYNLALLHLTLRQHASAFHFLSAAINLQPQVAALYKLLAVTLSRLDDAANAKKCYEHALRLDEKDPSIPLNFAVFLYNSGDATTAQRQLSLYDQGVKTARSGQTTVDRDTTATAQKLGSALSRIGEVGSVAGAKQPPDWGTPRQALESGVGLCRAMDTELENGAPLIPIVVNNNNNPVDGNEKTSENCTRDSKLTSGGGHGGADELCAVTTVLPTLSGLPLLTADNSNEDVVDDDVDGERIKES